MEPMTPPSTVREAITILETEWKIYATTTTSLLVMLPNRWKLSISFGPGSYSTWARRFSQECPEQYFQDMIDSTQHPLDNPELYYVYSVSPDAEIAIFDEHDNYVSLHPGTGGIGWGPAADLMGYADYVSLHQADNTIGWVPAADLMGWADFAARGGLTSTDHPPRL